MQRTPTLNKFIGQTHVVNTLKRQLKGAQSRREPFPHSLFIGPSGVGKTELARALAAEYSTSLIYLLGDRSPGELVYELTQLNNCDFLFLDEAHNLKPKSQEVLFQAIDSLTLQNIGKDPPGTNSNDNQNLVEIKPAAIVLATDQPGRLSNALQKRIPCAWAK